MIVAKRFRWEGAHRLPWHQGGCQNLHGHSYELWIEIEGEMDAHGMVLDFKDLKKAIKPLVDAWDHATVVAEADKALLGALTLLGTRLFVLPFDTTSENMALYAVAFFAAQAAPTLEAHAVSRIAACLHETETCYARLSLTVAEALAHAAQLGLGDAAGGDGALSSVQANT